MAVYVVFCHDRGGARDGFVEQRFKTRSSAFAGLEGLAVGTHDGAEFDVLQLDVLVAPTADDFAEFFKVLALAMVDDVKNCFLMPGLITELNRGQNAR